MVADDDLVAAVRHGKVLPLTTLGVTTPAPWPIITPTKTLIAVYIPHHQSTAKPALVLL